MVEISAAMFRRWVNRVDDDTLDEFLYDGLEELILELEQDDFFGTEGFEKRLA